MSTWRLAKSLETLRAEVNAMAPHRSKASDGTIGDTAHADRASRHNPNAEGVVCGMDITHDPANGCDIHALADALVLRLQQGGATNPDFEYVISNRMVASRKSGWIWAKYTGTNPHDKHVHFAVGRGPDSAPAFPYDDTIPWNIAGITEARPQNGDTTMEIIKVREDGKYYLLTGDVRQYIGDPAVLKDFQDAGVPVRTLGAKAFAMVIDGTTLNAIGLRSMPPAQWEALMAAIRKVSG